MSKTEEKPKPRAVKRCDYCEKEFTATHRPPNYCSVECEDAAYLAARLRETTKPEPANAEPEIDEATKVQHQIDERELYDLGFSEER